MPEGYAVREHAVGARFSRNIRDIRHSEDMLLDMLMRNNSTLSGFVSRLLYVFYMVAIVPTIGAFLGLVFWLLGWGGYKLLMVKKIGQAWLISIVGPVIAPITDPGIFSSGRIFVSSILPLILFVPYLIKDRPRTFICACFGAAIWIISSMGGMLAGV